MKNVAVIGGGIVGLCSAYFLSRSGHAVTIFDKGDLSNGCSVGNAGMIVPSHIFPLASPGMISKGIRWMFNSESPFYVRPRLNRDLLKWGYHFYKASTQEHVLRSIPALKAINLLSKELYQEMATTLPFDFGYQERGLLMLYQTRDTEHEEREAAFIAHANGIEAIVLTADEVQALEPGTRVRVRGGVHYPGDAHLTPQVLVRGLLQYLETLGVVIWKETAIKSFETSSGRITGVRTDLHQYNFDEYVISAGVWSSSLIRSLGVTVPMQGGKGYSFMLDVKQSAITVPTLLLEGRVAVTPMASQVRFGGTLEINGTDQTVNMKRVKGIVSTIPKYYPEIQVAVPAVGQVWQGLRPCSPDGLPFIGRSVKWENLVVATGHAMMGLSLAPATGLLVDEIVSERESRLSLSPFAVDRFA